MRKTLYLLTMLFSLVLFTNCSKDDDSSDKNSTNEIYQKLIGKWYFDDPSTNPTVNNSFTFNSDGHVTYTYWDGGKGNNYDSEKGTFNVIGEVLTMVFPEGVTLTFVQKVVVINNNKIEFKPTGKSGEKAYEGDYYRDGYTPPIQSIELQDYKVEFSGVGSDKIQYPLAVTYYKDSQNGSLLTEQISSKTNQDVVESRILNSYDKLGFKFTVGDGGTAYINSVIITNIKTKKVIFKSLNSLVINPEQTFIYDISEGNYTIK